MSETITDALKELITKQGGTFDANDDTIAELIQRLPEGSGGGSSLPEVTSEDNGDVLTVVNGAWAKAPASGGGGGVLSVGTTGENQDTLDKTWNEIDTSLKSGMVAAIKNYVDGGIFNYSFIIETKHSPFNPDEYDLTALYYDLENSGVTYLTFRADSLNGYPVFVDLED